MSINKKPRHILYEQMTYAIVAMLIDDFWGYCSERRITPTLLRFEDWVNERAKG